MDNTEKLITRIVEAQLNALKKKIDTLQATLDRVMSQLDEDRHEISNLKVNMAKLLAVSEGARDEIHDQTQTVVRKMEEHLQPMPDIVSDSVNTAIHENLENKPVAVIKRHGFLGR